MVIYVVYGGSGLCEIAHTREKAEELMAKHIEKFYKCASSYPFLITVLTPNEKREFSTPIDSKQLRENLIGFGTVKVKFVEDDQVTNFHLRDVYLDLDSKVKVFLECSDGVS